MKKIILSTFILIGVLLLLDYLLYQYEFLIGEQSWINMVDFLSKSVIIFLIFMNFLYNKTFDLNSKIFTITLYIALTLVFSMFIADRMVAINKFYYYSKTMQKGTTGKIWQFDDSLSYKGRPYAKGTYNYYIGDSIEGNVPVFFDSLGFRTIPDSINISSDTTDLYLGCSFTFGDFVPAQNTFAYLTSAALSHSCINGAISGYGAGQMIQIAERLLPKRKFRFVFIQLSSWIAFRAMDINGPTRFGYRPFPNFSPEGNSFKLNLPAYSTLMYTGKNWRKTDRTYAEKFQFSFSDGLKIEIHDYYISKFAAAKIRLGLLPKPATKQPELDSWFYNKMIDLCVKNGATPVLLKIQYPDSACRNLVKQLPSRTIIVDLDSELQMVSAEMGVKPEKLFRIYHVAGQDSIQYDAHPNKFTHSIFSRTILQTLNHK